MKKWYFILTLTLAFMVELPALEVFFVPGWRTGASARSGCVRIINDIWPGAPVTVKSWDSMVSLTEAVKNAEDFSRKLQVEILAMPSSRQQELILIGHSLGAAIVLDVLDVLAAQHKTIHSAALLGAPVPADDLRLWRALEAVRGRCYNVSFSGDGVLHFFYPVFEKGMPLGLAGWQFKHEKFAEKSVEQRWSFFNHYAYIYLEELDRLVDSLPEAPLDAVMEKTAPVCRFDERNLFRKIVAAGSNCSLLRHVITRRWQIVDRNGRLLHEGGEAEMKKIFSALQSAAVPAGEK